MAGDTEIKTIDFGCCFSWEEVEERLKKEFGYRLPKLEEVWNMNFEHDAIWISNKIKDKHCVMDMFFGLQMVSKGSYGLILIEKQLGEYDE